jgi:hypothetical protein
LDVPDLAYSTASGYADTALGVPGLVVAYAPPCEMITQPCALPAVFDLLSSCGCSAKLCRRHGERAGRLAASRALLECAKCGEAPVTIVAILPLRGCGD